MSGISAPDIDWLGQKPCVAVNGNVLGPKRIMRLDMTINCDHIPVPVSGTKRFRKIYSLLGWYLNNGINLKQRDTGTITRYQHNLLLYVSRQPVNMGRALLTTGARHTTSPRVTGPEIATL